MASDASTLDSSQQDVTKDSTSWAGPQDWERWREVISDLYTNNTLRQVVKIMKERHGFAATPKMYKVRLQKWGFAKNLKLGRVGAITSSDSSDIVSGRFMFHGRTITRKDVERYLKRRERGIDNSEPPSLTLQTRLDTAPLSPPLMSDSHLLFEHTFSSVRDFFAYSMNPDLDKGVDALRWPFRFLSIEAQGKASQFWTGAEQGASAFVSRNSAYDEYTLDNYTLLMREVHGCVRQVITFGTVQLFGNLLCKMLVFGKRPHIMKLFTPLAMLWKRWAVQLHFESHPFNRFCDCIIHSELDHISELLQRSWKCLADEFVGRLGELHAWSLLEKLDFDYHTSTDGGQPVRLSLLSECQLTKYDTRSLDILRYEALFLFEKGDFSNAERIARDIYSRAQHLDNGLLRSTYLSDIHYRIAHCRWAIKDSLSAVDHMWMALSTASPLQVLGITQRTQKIFSDLEKWQLTLKVPEVVIRQTPNSGIPS